MTDTLQRATITMVDRTSEGTGRQRRGGDVDGTSVTLDFNPETLTIKVQNATEKKGQRTNQRVQYVGTSFATLSFDAWFDSTRPRDDGQGLVSVDASGQSERLDVRQRTRVLAGLLDGTDDSSSGNSGGGRGGGGGQRDRYPRLVRFDWGSISFQGYVESYSEVLDFFSPDGVPLRAKVSVTLTEQSSRYHTSGDDRERWGEGGGGGQPAPGSPERPNNPGGGGPGTDGPRPDALQSALDSAGATLADAKKLASLAGLSDLMDLASVSLPSLGLSVGLDARIEVGLDLGLGIDLAVSAQANLGLSVDAALDVFGGAAVSAGFGGTPDLGRATSRAAPTPIVNRPGPWAPAGPAPGTAAHEIAGEVERARAGAGTREPSGPRSGAFTATNTAPTPPPPGTPPTPVRGSPPKLLARFGPPAPGPVFGRLAAIPTASGDHGRPSWERLPDGETGGAERTNEPGCRCARRSDAW